MAETLRVAGAQLPVTTDVASNVSALARAIDYAADHGADVLVTPEGSLSGYTHEFDAAAVERALAEVTALASRRRVGLVLGTCFEDPATRERYNGQRVYDKDGAFLGYHAKILLSRPLATPTDPGDSLFASKPLGTFLVGGVVVGGLVCNDLWANPEWTPMDDPHLTQKLSGLGARVIFHSVNSGQAEDEELALNRGYHEVNLRLRARGGRLWIVTADAADPAGRRASQSPSGVVGPDARWHVQTPPCGEQYFSYTITLGSSPC